MLRKEVHLWPHRGKGRTTTVVMGLFDTGASVSILNAEVARHMGLRWLPRSQYSAPLRLASADNT